MARELRRLREDHLELRRMIWDLRLTYAVRSAFNARYRPDQPRVPAGSREGGRWTSDGTLLATDLSSARKVPPVVKEFGKWTMRQYASRYCQASTNRKLPGEFENVTIEDIWNIARGGNARARTCLKLLKEELFRK